MVKPSYRRQFLAALGTGSLAFAAGCAGQLPRNSENGNADNESGNGKGATQQAPPPALNHGSLVSNFDKDFGEWYALAGDLTADEETVLTGSQTARIENTGATAGIARSFPDGFDMTGKHLSLAVKVDVPRPARVTVRLLASGEADQVWSTRTIISTYTGWLRMDVGYTGQRGEPLFDNVQEIRITLDDPNASQANEEQGQQDTQAENETQDIQTGNETPAGNETQNETQNIQTGNETPAGNETQGIELQIVNETQDTQAGNHIALAQKGDGNQEDEGEQKDADIRFWVDDLRTTPAADQGYVMLTFDDAVASQYENAFPLLEDHGMQAVAAVVPDSLNRDGRLAIDQLREMRDAGWDISSHPEGTGFREFEDPETIQQDIESSYEYLNNRGFSDGARHMFVPYHTTNQEIVDITREYHELSSYFGGTPNAVPFTDPMHLSRVNMFDLDAFKSMIDIAAEYNQLAIGLAHGVVPKREIENDPHADMTTEQLEELLAYIEDSDVQAVTASQLLDNQDSL